ncbi:twin-arginine translocase TatA/TatE family subunit [uncultured Methanomethylovorans sp.]|uniref:twin-arginine translocase TatA/TatE family subunit n=1 Tax=uncultured Methanomethylovorans sp. TaxID=183759 RepID=UPI002AA7F030|nr:twin-arginine translocase TatA/TatE family subunit [uncultured Methanomethylovorans sp.]
MIGGIGSSEMLLIFAALLLLFGATKLPELARSMGTSMGEFKKAQKESEESLKNYEKSIKEKKVDNAQDQDKDSNVKQVAANLGINTEGKSKDELLAEINTLLKKD